MKVEANLICEILRSSPITINELSERLHLHPNIVRDFIVNLIEMKMLTLRFNDERLMVEPVDRLKLALHAIRLGADIKNVSLCLSWREFEEFCAFAFNAHEYVVLRNFRFKCYGRRFEIDVIGVRRPFVLCVDCKRWSSARFSALHKVALDHFSKVESLSKCKFALIKLGVHGWSEIIFLPIILTVHEDKTRFYEGIPLVPVFKFNSFLSEFEAYILDLRVVRIKG